MNVVAQCQGGLSKGSGRDVSQPEMFTVWFYFINTTCIVYPILVKVSSFQTNAIYYVLSVSLQYSS